MLVTFPIFKGLAEKASGIWDSWKQYRSRTRTPSKTSHEAIEARSNPSATQRGLPRVPKGTLHTLISFIRGQQSSQNDEKSRGVIMTQDTDIEMVPHSRLHSMEVETMYHSHLVEQSSQRNLVACQAESKRM